MKEDNPQSMYLAQFVQAKVGKATNTGGTEAVPETNVMSIARLGREDT